MTRFSVFTVIAASAMVPEDEQKASARNRRRRDHIGLRRLSGRDAVDEYLRAQTAGEEPIPQARRSDRSDHRPRAMGNELAAPIRRLPSNKRSHANQIRRLREPAR